ncbi:hypothetical protein [Melittangium boletus]|uniref:hypothetical protein n=1 Tax=Melittangium boletus TaxID=83453 RepID=UPI000BB2D299|nr:hypothetical protein [Melittangium boletus]
MGALLVLLGASCAHAEWRTPLRLSERPSELLDVWAPDSFTMGFNASGGNGVYLVVNGSEHRIPTAAREPMGSYYDSLGDCLFLVERTRTRRAQRPDGTSCGGDLSKPLIADNPLDISPVKHTTEGGAVLLAPRSDDSSFNIYLSEGRIDATDRNPVFSVVKQVTESYPSLGLPFGVVNIEGTVHAYVGGQKGGALGYWANSTPAPLEQWQGPLSLGFVSAVDLFSVTGSPHPYAVVGAANVFIQGSRNQSGDSLEAVQSLAPGSEILSLSINVDPNSDAGYGFGMAVVLLPGGGWGLMSPVPMGAQTQAGTKWISRNLPPALQTLDPLQVACVGSAYCVLTGTEGTAGRAFPFFNTAGPVLSLEAPGALVDLGSTAASVTIDENTAPELTFKGTDADEDPVRLVVVPPTGIPAGWKVEVTSAEPGEPVKMKASGGALCQTLAAGSFQVQASDGLADHEISRPIELFLRHTVPPVMPPVKFEDGTPVPSDGNLGTLLAGSAPLKLLAEGTRSAANCQVTKRWSAVGGMSGGPTPMSSADGVTLTPPATSCAPTERTFAFDYEVTDEGGLSSTQRFLVRQPGWTGVSTVEPLLELWLDPKGSGAPEVRVSSDLDCARERELKAEVSLEPVGGGVAVWTKTVGLSETVSLAESRLCGRFQVTARLVDSTNERSRPTVRQVELAGGGVALEALPETPLVAECGRQASLTLTPTFPPEACQNPDVTWRFEDGPLTALTPQPGGAVELLTERTDLDSRVGRSVRMTVTASMGSQTVAGPHEVRITTRPFVEVSRRTELSAASETGLVGVSVDLFNTTACDVTEVRHVERLRGLGYVADSAKFDGQPLEHVSWNEATGELIVEQLELLGQRHGTLTYVTRPHLVGDRLLSGGTWLRGERISLNDGGDEPPGSGCGCASSSPGSLLLALVAWVGATRRRRPSPTARS